jgi:hypothetical protein
MPFPLGEALALQESGLMMLSHGDRDAARERLEGAATLFDRLGALLESERTIRFIEQGAAV